VLFLLTSAYTYAQKAERGYIRKGNHFFNDSTFVDAEVNYRKAIEVNPQSAVSMYNLGRTLSMQHKAKDAMEQYVAASKIEKDKTRLGQIYRNIGVLQQTNKEYAKAVDAYKMSLRNDPTDNETRYNLALAQKMLKDQQQQNKDQNKDNKDKDKKDQKKDQKQDQNKDKQNDQKKDDKKDQQQQPPKPQKQDNQMSKENAEQMLNAAMQDEKNVQDKVKKQQRVVESGKLEKDW
jgi:tetratricopeptide (TPR) repeat protein